MSLLIHYLSICTCLEWYRKLGEKIWSPYHTRWAYEQGMFNLYPNLPGRRALSDSHQDKGVTAGEDLGLSSTLIKKLNKNDWVLLPVNALARYDFCFEQVPEGQEPQKEGDIDCTKQRYLT